MWGDMRDDPDNYHTYYTHSGDGGETFLENSRVTDYPSNPAYGIAVFVGDYWGIVATDKDVYMVWTDSRAGFRGSPNQDIGFARMRPVRPPSMFISPPQGPAGQVISIVGDGFAARQKEVFIEVDGVVISSFPTDNAGRFTATIYVPVSGEGPHLIRAIDVLGNVAEATYYTSFGFNNVNDQLKRLEERMSSRIEEGLKSMPREVDVGKLADEVKSKIEFAIAYTARPVLETFKGFRILDENRLEVYVDYWNFETSYIAEYAEVFGGGMPWELLAASDDLVFNRRLVAYSDTAAARFRVDQLNLVLREHVSLVRTVVNDFISKQLYPEKVFTVAGKRYETLEGALARYRALQGWLNTYNLAVVSCGPYILAVFDPAAQYAELRAFRDPTYPFKPGKWYFGTVDRPRLQRVEGAVTIGADTRITLSTAGAGEVVVSYILRDPVTGSVVDSGGGRVSGGVFTISLPAQKTSRLTPGYLELTAVVYSEEVAQANTVTQRVEVRREGPATTDTKTVQTTPVTTQVQEAPQPPIGLIIAVVGVAVVAAATALILRRRKTAPTAG